MMSLPLILGVISVASVGYAKPPQQIVGGTLAREGEFPYIVSINMRGFHFCGGSIISDRHILTAAHCVAGLSAAQRSTIRIRAGSTQFNLGGKVYTPEKFKWHEKYDDAKEAPPYDIAIITVKEKIEFTDKIKKIELANSEPSSGDDVTAIGWGMRTAKSIFPPTQLYKVTIKSLSSDRCRWYHAGRIDKTHVCSLGPVGQGICMGDSGGPLELNGKLVGIVSFGLPCAIGYPDVLTSVYHFKNWIDNVIGY